MLSYFEDIERPILDFNEKPHLKTVYVLVFEDGQHFKEKIAKICDSFSGKRFKLPEEGHGDKKAYRRKIEAIEKKIEET